MTSTPLKVSGSGAGFSLLDLTACLEDGAASTPSSSTDGSPLAARRRFPHLFAVANLASGRRSQGASPSAQTQGSATTQPNSTKGTPVPVSIVLDDPKHPPVFHEEFTVAVSVVPKPRDRYSKDEAATKIQALHRGHAERKRHSMRIQKRSEPGPEEVSARADDASGPTGAEDDAPTARGEATTDPTTAATTTSSSRYSKDEAATKIQSVHRGHMERKRHQTRMQQRHGLLAVADDEGDRVPDIDDGEAAAQEEGIASEHGDVAAVEAEGENAAEETSPNNDDSNAEQSRRDAAATKIQALQRGHAARKQHRDRVQNRDKRLAQVEVEPRDDEAHQADDDHHEHADTTADAEVLAGPAPPPPQPEEDPVGESSLAKEEVDAASPASAAPTAAGPSDPASALTPAKPRGYQTHLVYRRRRDASPSHQLELTMAQRTLTQTQGADVLTDAATGAAVGPGSDLKPLAPRKPGILPGISRHKPVRVEDPLVQALEAKIRERRQKERQREDETRRKQEAIREAFERRQQEIEAENQRKKAEQLRLAREAAERRAEEMKDLERQRQERLAKMLKADMDVITGRKNIVSAFQERFEQQQAQIVQERREALKRRHEQFGPRGPDFYRDIKEHELRVQEEHEARRRQLEERRQVEEQQGRSTSPQIVADPTHVTRAHRRILAEKKQRLAEEQADEERIRARIHYARDYAEDVRHHKAPKPVAPPPRKPSKKRVLSDAFKQLGERRRSSQDMSRQPRAGDDDHRDSLSELPAVTSNEDISQQ